MFERFQSDRSNFPVLRQASELCLASAPDGPGLRVAQRLEASGADIETCIAALLGDPALQPQLTAAQIEAQAGAVIANLVKHVRWLDKLDTSASAEEIDARQPERIRRMVLAMVDDVRAVLVKMAYRVEHLRHLAAESYEARHAVARETLDIYAPLANRLGLGQLKWELEDLSFRYLEPQAYKTLAKALEEKRAQRESYLAGFLENLAAALRDDGIGDFDANGRPKHIYSIWRKMRRKQLAFGDLFDVRAVRVLVDSVSDCYLVLGAVHSRWRHIPSEFDDYIANPKKNRYQSLHTAIVGPGGKAVEVQIRTREMHQFAEFGVAAHWQYKEGGQRDEYLQSTVRELRNLLEEGGGDSLLDTFRSEAFADRVFVFTPRGEVIDLPRGATPLDFAYEVHTQVGHRCRGAKINGHIVNLRTRLNNGDQVEILTTRNPKPSRDWLNKDLGYLVSSRARSKVRHWFNQQSLQQQIEDGRQLLERELRRLGKRGVALEKVVALLGRGNAQDLYAAVSRNEITGAQIAQAFEPPPAPAAPAEPAPEDAAQLETRRSRARSDSGITVRGVGDLLTHFARCCNPVPFDPVIGYITRGSGVTIHRADCHNALRSSDSDRYIEVDWSNRDGDLFAAAIKVVAFNRRGLLSDVAAAVSAEGVAINSAQVDTDRRRNLANLHLRIEVSDHDQLRKLMDKIGQLPNVLSAARETA